MLAWQPTYCYKLVIMKWILFLASLAFLYTYMLLHTTNIVLNQAQNLNAAYQSVARNTDKLAEGH